MSHMLASMVLSMFKRRADLLLTTYTHTKSVQIYIYFSLYTTVSSIFFIKKCKIHIRA